MDHPKLTPRQQQILDLIQSSIARTGAPPTRAEIASSFGFKSANAAEEHLQALARKGRGAHAVQKPASLMRSTPALPLAWLVPGAAALGRGIATGARADW